MHLRTIDLTKKVGDIYRYRMRAMPDHKLGKHCIIVPYRDKRIIRVFTSYPLEDWKSLDTFFWGDKQPEGYPRMHVRLIDATKIQNIAWLYKLAPRVYEIVKVKIGKQKFWGQICEDLGDNFCKEHDEALVPYGKVKSLGKVYGFKNAKDDVSKWDVIDKKLVDFNTFHFTEDHKIKMASAYSRMSRYGKKYYHDVLSLGLENGPRKNDIRVRWMKLADISFKGKSVLDLGSSGGFFCRYVKSRGAKEVVGIDCSGYGSPDPVTGAYLASFEEGFYDIDYLEIDLKDEFLDEKFDYVFYFSMTFHLGVPKWLPDVTNKICIVEDNSKERNADVELKKIFRKIVYKDESTDRGEEAGHGLKIYWCYK